VTSRYIWVDVEATGLDPYKHSLLEIAVLESEFYKPFDVRTIHQATFYFHPDLVKTLDPVVREMHTKNGLFKECVKENSNDVFESEDELLRLMPNLENEDDKPVLAGSSVHFDGDFIKVHMPRLHKRLSHRHFDVSTMKMFCEGLGMQPIVKRYAHRALPDVMESAEHGLMCQEWMKHNLR